MDENEYEEHWLVQQAKYTAKGVVAASDQDAIKELSDFLASFALRQQNKLLALLRSHGN